MGCPSPIAYRAKLRSPKGVDGKEVYYKQLISQDWPRLPRRHLNKETSSGEDLYIYIYIL